MKARRSTGPCALNVRCYKYFGWSRLVSALSLPFQLLISIDSNDVESCRNSGMHRDGIPDLLHDDTLDVLNNLPRVIRGEHTNQRAIMIPLFAATCEITELRSPLKTVQMFQNTSAERHRSGPQSMATQLQHAKISSLDDQIPSDIGQSSARFGSAKSNSRYPVHQLTRHPTIEQFQHQSFHCFPPPSLHGFPLRLLASSPCFVHKNA